MAAAHQRGAGWVLARPLRQPRTGNLHRPQISQPQRNPSSPSRISCRLPASSSFVLAAARLRALQPDSWLRGEKTRAAARKDPEEQSAQPGGARSHRAWFVRPLDTGGPYGCRRQVELKQPGKGWRADRCDHPTAAGSLRCLRSAHAIRRYWRRTYCLGGTSEVSPGGAGRGLSAV